VSQRDCEKSAAFGNGSVAVWQIKASENPALLNFIQFREKLSSEKLPRSAPGAQAELAPTPLRGVMPRSGMPGAFCHGIVKNQRGSAAKVWRCYKSE
jgi:hypothetical protein